jgi:hypothetical protein
MLFFLGFVFLPRQLFFKSDHFGLECRGFAPLISRCMLSGLFNINDNTCYLFKKKMQIIMNNRRKKKYREK